MVKKLSEFPILKKISNENLGLLISYMVWESVDPGNDILQENDNGDEMYFLIDGTVEIWKKNLFGEEYFCTNLTDDKCCVFGEMSVLDGEKRSATVRAKTKCMLLKLSAEKFLKFCREVPDAGVELILFIAVNVSKNLRQENEKLLELYDQIREEI